VRGAGSGPTATPPATVGQQQPAAAPRDPGTSRDSASTPAPDAPAAGGGTHAAGTASVAPRPGQGGPTAEDADGPDATRRDASAPAAPRTDATADAASDGRTDAAPAGGTTDAASRTEATTGGTTDAASAGGSTDAASRADGSAAADAAPTVPSREGGPATAQEGPDAAPAVPSGEGGPAAAQEGPVAADLEPADEVGPDDPEQFLASIRWRFDPETLREITDNPDQLREVRDALTAKVSDVADNPARARLLSLRAVVSRVLGDLQQAQADGKLALAHAEATGELRRIAIVRARLAHVLQWRGEYAEADRLFALANSPELPERLRGTMHQHIGRSAYEQGRYIEACNHFEKALMLRRQEDPELIAATEVALDAVFRKVAADGWGPYPRTPEEILQVRRAPTATLDDETGLWGYADPDAGAGIPARYVDVQPFRDGVAWVLPAGATAWELIDESGRTVLPATLGYRSVGSFSDGMAWVSHDGTRWLGIDKAGAVVISTGYEDVRPFRGGLAAVRRDGRWGAVDAVGRVVVPYRYDGFATALSDGRYIDGFSDEGLAVVQREGRKGVVDRTGRVLVEPLHQTLVIHPVAFLITDGSGRWGALDRRGRLLVPPEFPSRDAVDEEIDRLMADTRPVL
jgi:tetratricopeptide (TPR) repeat protein